MSTIMSWGECTIEIGKTLTNDVMATTLESIGVIKEKTVTLETSDGEKLQAFASGHKLVAQEEQNGDIVLTARIIEPDLEFLERLCDAVYTSGVSELKVNSLLVSDAFSVKLTPKNIGATGIRIRKASVKIKPGVGEDEGQYADISFTVLQCADDELFTYFKRLV